MSEPTLKARAWALFDGIVERPARAGYINPWAVNEDGEASFRPDYPTLTRLLGVPLMLGATSQSGVPALALDVWTAYELRRAGFSPDLVWPRASPPRILPSTLVALRAGATAAQRRMLDDMLASGKTFDGEAGATANLLGGNYVKQVDVVMSSWATGPELMVSTKRMDSSFGKNAANRVEESYGDAKNLRSRHPRAALGFVYALRSTAFTGAPRTAEWIVDLLAKLGRPSDAYDAVALLVPEWDGLQLPADEEGWDPLVAAGLRPEPPSAAEQRPAALGEAEMDRQLSSLPAVRLRTDLVPPALSPGLFFGALVRRVLDNSPVTFHAVARDRLRNAAVQE